MFKDEIKQKFNAVDGIFPFTLNMLSRKKTVICGVKKVIFLSENRLKIRLDCSNLTIDGVGLKIVEIGGGDMFLEGQIDKIEFENR